MAITNSILTLASANAYVSSGNTVISTMYFCNQGATTANLNVWVVPYGNSVVTSTFTIYREVQIASNDTLVVDMEKLVLANGDQIKANAGGTLNATISYVGI